jgi:hypothetical protein
MKLLLGISLFLGMFSVLSAQETAGEKLVLIHGVVFDAFSQAPIGNVHFSVNNHVEGATDNEGKFSIYVYRGDTLSFSFLGHRDVLFTTDTLPGKSYVTGIFMQADTLQIGEVIVMPRMGDLKTEFMNSSGTVSQEMVNAQNNITISAYQGLANPPRLGDPGTNYELLKQKQAIAVYEKGGIPSDRILGLNLISLIPASIYLLTNGLPEKPAPPAPRVTIAEIEKMKKAYRESLLQKN